MRGEWVKGRRMIGGGIKGEKMRVVRTMTREERMKGYSGTGL
jgi:hypothetical protein